MVKQWHWDANHPGMVEHPNGAYVLVTDVEKLLPRHVLIERDVVNALVALTDAFLQVHGRFPLDRVTPEQVAINDAMQEAYRLIGQPKTNDRKRKVSTLLRRRRVRHLKRNSTYQVLGEAEAQVSKGTLAEHGRLLSEGQKITVYRAEEGGKLWVRFPDEFEDGRYEEIE